MSEDDPGLWPVLVSETIADMLPAERFSAVARSPWRLPGTHGWRAAMAWKTIQTGGIHIPHGYGITKYRIRPATP